MRQPWRYIPPNLPLSLAKACVVLLGFPHCGIAAGTALTPSAASSHRFHNALYPCGEGSSLPHQQSPAPPQPEPGSTHIGVAGPVPLPLSQAVLSSDRGPGKPGMRWKLRERSWFCGSSCLSLQEHPGFSQPCPSARTDPAWRGYCQSAGPEQTSWAQLQAHPGVVQPCGCRPNAKARAMSYWESRNPAAAFPTDPTAMATRMHTYRGLSQWRMDDDTPPPHVLLHSPQDDQAPQAPSTPSGRVPKGTHSLL